MDLEQTISQIGEQAQADLDAASTLEAIEAVRVEVLGRKGKLAEISKEFGKLTPEERARSRQASERRQAGNRTAFEHRKAA